MTKQRKDIFRKLIKEVYTNEILVSFENAINSVMIDNMETYDLTEEDLFFVETEADKIAKKLLKLLIVKEKINVKE